MVSLFHGSNVTVSEPKIIVSNRNLDFGTGFYTTTNQSQAEQFALRIATLRKEGNAMVNRYTFDEKQAKKQLSVLSFKSPNGQWLDFVSAHRTGMYTGERYDIIIGPVANDDVFRTINIYLAGTITRSETLRRLKIKRLFNQYVFCTEKALSYLHFESSYQPQGDAL